VCDEGGLDLIPQRDSVLFLVWLLNPELEISTNWASVVDLWGDAVADDDAGAAADARAPSRAHTAAAASAERMSVGIAQYHEPPTKHHHRDAARTVAYSDSIAGDAEPYAGLRGVSTRDAAGSQRGASRASRKLSDGSGSYRDDGSVDTYWTMRRHGAAAKPRPGAARSRVDHGAMDSGFTAPQHAMMAGLPPPPAGYAYVAMPQHLQRVVQSPYMSAEPY
jgi:hypothetical protein